MKKTVWLTYLIGAVTILAMFLPACAGPSISVKSGTGFTHETSVRVPFSQGESIRLYVDNEGTTVFIKYIETYHGQVNPEKEYRLEIYRVDKNGVLETEKFGPFDTVQSLRPEGNFIVLDNNEDLTYINASSLSVWTVADSYLANIIRSRSPAAYYGNGLVVYSLLVPDEPGSENGVVVYDTSTKKEVRADLQEEYVSIDTLDMDEENILIKATKSNHEPPDLYVLGLDGSIKFKLNLYYCKDPNSCDARLVPGGLIVAATDVTVVDTGDATSQIGRASVIKRYSFDETEVWSKAVHQSGIPGLKLLPSNNSVLVFTLSDFNDKTGFIGYFDADNGKQLYARTLQNDSSILPLDTAATFYIYPRWSLYPEIPPPTGKVTLFGYDTELATVDLGDGIYYFAASPSGKYFAAVSDGTLSIFSTTKSGG